MRLAGCYFCNTLTRLANYANAASDPDGVYDVLLVEWIQRHRHGVPEADIPGPQHAGAILWPFHEGDVQIEDGKVVGTDEQTQHFGEKISIGNEIEKLRGDLQSATHTQWAIRDEFKEEALGCFVKHHNPSWPDKKCPDYHADSKLLGRKNMPKEHRIFLCAVCLAGETEVITRQGTRTMAELAVEGKAELLTVPVHQGEASFREVPIHSFGVHPLWRIELSRGRSRKVVYATADHRWEQRNRAGQQRQRSLVERVVQTSELQPGMVLRSASRKSAVGCTGEHPSSVGIMHGFTYGDGVRPSGDRASRALIFHNGKDEALLPFFAGGRMRQVTVRQQPTGLPVNVDRVTEVLDLPRAWKKGPDLSESRSYLLGFLAGYFAADGSVSAVGQAVIESADIGSLRMFKEVGHIVGLQSSPIQSRMRIGVGDIERPLHRMTINTGDLPTSFWLIEAHATRVLPRKRERYDWTVVGVSETDRVEEVFCAMVEGSERFVLEDNLVTFNCPYEETVRIEKRRRAGMYRR